MNNMSCFVFIDGNCATTESISVLSDCRGLRVSPICFMERVVPRSDHETRLPFENYMSALSYNQGLRISPICFGVRVAPRRDRETRSQFEYYKIHKFESK